MVDGSPVWVLGQHHVNSCEEGGGPEEAGGGLLLWLIAHDRTWLAAVVLAHRCWLSDWIQRVDEQHCQAPICGFQDMEPF